VLGLGGAGADRRCDSCFQLVSNAMALRRSNSKDFGTLLILLNCCTPAAASPSCCPDMPGTYLKWVSASGLPEGLPEWPACL
jgi:hypothetical protein